MPSGVPLTPDEIERAARVYAETANYSAAARAIGHDTAVSAVRAAIIKRGDDKRSILHERALARGLADGTAMLRRIQQKLGKMLEDELDAGNAGAIDPSQAAQLTNALSKTQDTLGRTALVGKQMRKLEAETELATAKANGTASPDTVIMQPGDAEFERLMVEKWGSKRQGAKMPADESDGKPAASDPLTEESDRGTVDGESER